MPGELFSLRDGLGIRRVETDGRTHTEVLQLAPALAEHATVEHAIRGRVSRHADLDVRSFAPVRHVERVRGSLRIFSEMPAGVRLSDLLEYLESTGEVVAESAMLELASLVINAVASLHAWPGGLAHGALNPSHVLITNDGRVMLTDCVFGAGLEVLQRNRESLWKEFHLAMPPSANLARFDQQTDVTQMGAVILAIVLQRPMRPNEYPRAVSDLIMTATQASAAGSPEAAAMRMWLQEALQVHPRAAFRSAVESQRAFADINSRPGARRAGAMALQVLLRTTCGATTNQMPVSFESPATNELQPAPVVVPRPPVHAQPSHTTLDSILRSVLQKH